jgi:hypothetical protein
MRWSLCRFVFCLICCPAITCAGQAASPPASVDYSKEAFVDEEDLTKISFENDGTNTRDCEARMKPIHTS